MSSVYLLCMAKSSSGYTGVLLLHLGVYIAIYRAIAIADNGPLYQAESPYYSLPLSLTPRSSTALDVALCVYIPSISFWIQIKVKLSGKKPQPSWLAGRFRLTELNCSCYSSPPVRVYLAPSIETFSVP